MVDIDPLVLVSQTPLRCFVEEYRNKLVRYLDIYGLDKISQR